VIHYGYIIYPNIFVCCLALSLLPSILTDKHKFSKLCHHITSSNASYLVRNSFQWLRTNVLTILFQIVVIVHLLRPCNRLTIMLQQLGISVP